VERFRKDGIFGKVISDRTIGSELSEICCFREQEIEGNQRWD
jgi:hypothetical protein